MNLYSKQRESHVKFSETPHQAQNTFQFWHPIQKYISHPKNSVTRIILTQYENLYSSSMGDGFILKRVQYKVNQFTLTFVTMIWWFYVLKKDNHFQFFLSYWLQYWILFPSLFLFSFNRSSILGQRWLSLGFKCSVCCSVVTLTSCQ